MRVSPSLFTRKLTNVNRHPNRTGLYVRLRVSQRDVAVLTRCDALTAWLHFIPMQVSARRQGPIVAETDATCPCRLTTPICGTSWPSSAAASTASMRTTISARRSPSPGKNGSSNATGGPIWKPISSGALSPYTSRVRSNAHHFSLLRLLLEYGRLYTDETHPGSNDFDGDTCVELPIVVRRRTALTLRTPDTGRLNRSGMVRFAKRCKAPRRLRVRDRCVPAPGMGLSLYNFRTSAIILLPYLPSAHLHSHDVVTRGYSTRS